MEAFNELEMLKKFKEKSGWSYERIAREIGVSYQTVMSWFTGKYKLSNLSKKAVRAFLINHF